MAHRSRAASLRRTSQSAVASRAPSVPSASNCRTVVRSTVTFFISRCRSTRTLSLKGHLGESKIQRTTGDFVLLADAGLVGEPDFYRVAVKRLLARNCLQARGEVFLKSSIAPSACAW